MADCYIYDAVRTPRGRGFADGSLHEVPSVDIAAHVLRMLQARHNLDTSLIDDVILGCVSPIGENGTNIARMAVLRAGYPHIVAGVQINRFCSSGLEAVNMAAAQIMAGQADIMIGGGVEMMSRVPMGSDSGAWHINPNMAIDHYFIPQGVSADLIATRYHISRETADSYALQSQQRAAHAWAQGYFSKSIVPVCDMNGLVLLDHDEHMRPQITMQQLAAMPPAFADMGKKAGFDDIARLRYPEIEAIRHIHHAGNSSGIVDGAAAVLLGTGEAGKKIGLSPRARIRAFASIGSEPCIMLTGPVDVAQKILNRTGMTLADIDLHEVNETFAAVVLHYLQKLDIDPDCINVNGGAIAKGHPLGASGAILLGTVLDELERRDQQTALVNICAAGGMATAMIIERF